jgi:predicted flap endonuclease-1-like 5' DNA nuclease
MNPTGWLVFLGIVILTFILVWALLTKRPSPEQLAELHHEDHGNHGSEQDHSSQLVEEDVNRTNEMEPFQASASSEEGSGPTVTEPLQVSDNLEIIEGIGPRIAQLLRDVGINTFSQLAGADVDQLRALLVANKLQMVDPASWPEQAKLAISDDRSALQDFQKRLKGGRQQ